MTLLDSIKLGWQWLHHHPYMLVAVVMLLAALLAKLVDMIFVRLLQRVLMKTSTDVDNKIAGQLHKPVQLSVVLLAAIMLEDEVFMHFTGGKVTMITKTILLVVWTWAIVRCSRIVFGALIERHRGESTGRQVLPLLDNVVSVAVVGHSAYWLLRMWSVDVTPLLASAGIVTAAVALASKDTLANLFGGISIFVDRPYSLGDYVILPTGERGEVINIGLRSTRLLTRDDVLIALPNSVISNAKIINESGHVDRYRVRAKVGVSYDSDPDQVESVLLSALDGVAHVLPDPTPRVRFRSFGDSALEFELLCWVRLPAQRGMVLHEINRSILLGLRGAGIEIPFPQRVVHMVPPQGEQEPAGD